MRLRMGAVVVHRTTKYSPRHHSQPVLLLSSTIGAPQEEMTGSQELDVSNDDPPVTARSGRPEWPSAISQAHRHPRQVLIAQADMTDGRSLTWLHERLTHTVTVPT